MTIIYDTVFPPQPTAPIRPPAKPLPLGLNNNVPAQLPCKGCNGDGYSLNKGFRTEDKVFPSRWSKCHCCDGVGWFDAPDLSAIVKAIKGRKPKSLRSKRPDSPRDYFVWRLARFHGGKDVCLPMCAEMDVAGDPYKHILDELARIVAKAFFGSGNVGTARWQQAMYGSHDFTDVPDDFGFMPVYDADKPLEEMLETV